MTRFSKSAMWLTVVALPLTACATDGDPAAEATTESASAVQLGKGASSMLAAPDLAAVAFDDLSDPSANAAQVAAVMPEVIVAIVQDPDACASFDRNDSEDGTETTLTLDQCSREGGDAILSGTIAIARSPGALDATLDSLHVEWSNQPGRALDLSGEFQLRTQNQGGIYAPAEQSLTASFSGSYVDPTNGSLAIAAELHGQPGTLDACVSVSADADPYEIEIDPLCVAFHVEQPGVFTKPTPNGEGQFIVEFTAPEIRYEGTLAGSASNGTVTLFTGGEALTIEGDNTRVGIDGPFVAQIKEGDITLTAAGDADGVSKRYGDAYPYAGTVELSSTSPWLVVIEQLTFTEDTPSTAWAEGYRYDWRRFAGESEMYLCRDLSGEQPDHSRQADESCPAQ